MGPEQTARVGAYRLEEQIGEGAIGLVFRARRESDGATVALKLLKEDLARDRIYRRRLAHEVRVASTIRHRNLVPVLDTGDEHGRPYLVSRYVDGPSLAERIRAAAPMPVSEVVRSAADVAAGLTALHRNGLVHRDVKPANVLVDRNGSSLLTDFGLAKGPALTALTRSGQIVGTPQYLAPELVNGTSEATPASDVYSLGCLVFACLTGAPPFTGGFLEVAFAQLEEQPRDPCADRDDSPAGFGGIVLAALEKEPAERPRTPTAYTHMLRLAAGLAR